MKILCTFKKLISLKKYDKAMLMLLFLTLFLFSCSSESSGGYSYTSNAFIFSLSNKEGLKPFKSNVRRPEYAIYRSSKYGPRFGSRVGIIIVNHANRNKYSRAYLGYSYPALSEVMDRRTILAGDVFFYPDDWEVFYLA